MRVVAFAVFLLVAAVASFLPEGQVLTPYGPRPKACVLEVPSGSRIIEEEGGVRVRHADGEFFYAAAQECHEDNAVGKYLEAKEKKQVPGLGTVNGWLDYTGWYPPAGENNLDSFTSTYTVPGNPTSNTGQVLFYFIGIQDNAYPSVNILQPVLTWGNGLSGWNFASWDCCPSNITVQSKSIGGVVAGDKLAGTIKRLDADTWYIDTTLLRTGQNTTLYPQVGSYLYNWADVTLEVYYVNTCQEYAVGPMTFNSLTLKDVQQQVLTPSWQFTPTTNCNGRIVQSTTDPTQMYIQHN